MYQQKQELKDRVQKGRGRPCINPEIWGSRNYKQAGTIKKAGEIKGNWWQQVIKKQKLIEKLSMTFVLAVPGATWTWFQSF